MLATLLLLAAWLYAWRSTIAYAIDVFSADVYRLNLYLLLAIVALLVLKRRKPALERSPALEAVPLLLIFGSVLAGLFFTRVADIRLFAAVAFGAGSYGLFGLYTDRATWKSGFPAAMLLVLALPFGEQASTYAGFSARVFTAKVVELLLESGGVDAISSSAVLATESGVAYVDVPCSGVKSLWTGAIFFLGATHVERARLGLRWLAALAIFCALLLAANVARVAIIVLLAVVLDQKTAADVLHEPLGILGFALAGCAGWILLRHVQKDSCTEDHERRSSPKLAVLLAAGALCAGLFMTRASRNDQRANELEIALSIPTQQLELTPAEAGLLARVGESELVKLRFDGGSALFLATSRFRAHHPPEICLASAGAKIERVEPISFGAKKEARLVSLDGGARTALYFYQSGEVTTGDLLARVWSDAFERQSRWVLVSILIDRPVAANDPELAELYEIFRRGAKS